MKLKLDATLTHVSIDEYNRMADQRDAMRAERQQARAALAGAKSVLADVAGYLKAYPADTRALDEARFVLNCAGYDAGAEAEVEGD